MRRLVAALVTLFALLPLALVTPAADAGGQATDPYVKQSTLRFRTAGGPSVTKMVTVVNPTSNALYWYFEGDYDWVTGNATVGTCEGSDVAANSSCTFGVNFRVPYGTSSPYTWTGTATFRFVTVPAGDPAGSDTVDVIGKYVVR